MNKRPVLLLTFFVSLLVIGVTAWAAGPVMTAPAPAPVRTLKPVPIPTVNPTPTSPAGAVQQAIPQTAPQATLQTTVPQAQMATPTMKKVSDTYKFDTKGSQYFNELMFGMVYPGSATGVLTAPFTNPNVSGTTGDQFHNIGYKKKICVPKPWPFSGCIWEHTYGTTVGLDFNVSGPVTYNYNVPYTIDFVFPVSVFPGQRIYLVPNFRWPADVPPSIVSTMNNYIYSAGTSTWADAPFDGMDDLTMGFTQYNNYANISAGIPVLPLFPAAKGAWNINFPPFSSGGGEVYPGSYVKLGGTDSLRNAGNESFNEGLTSICVRAGGTSGTAWKTGQEQFEFTAKVLEMTPPPVDAVGVALDAARLIGDFKLNTNLEGNIQREDYVCLELSDLPYVDVPDRLALGTSAVWSFTNQPVTLRYRVYGVSSFGYNLGIVVNFDMRGIDPKNIWNSPTLYFHAGGAQSPWQEQSAVFNVSGKIPIKPREAYSQALVYTASNPLPNTVQPLSNQQIIRRVPVGARLATPQQIPTVIQDSGTVPFPKPTALRGTPQGREYTVVLGAAAQARADQIVALLKRMGISAFVVTSGSTTEPVVTLGAFLSKAQAEQLAGMIKEIYKVDSDVVQSISRAKVRSLGDDVVKKLNIPL